MQKSFANHLSKTNSHQTSNQAEIIAAKFSNKALDYDQFAKVQRFAAKHLDEQIAKNINAPVPSTILEIGCGTGLLSRHLVSRFQKAKINFIDPAAAMLNLCESNVNKHLNLSTTSRNHNFINKSIEDYLSDATESQQTYSLIVSSFALHWVINLSSVINRLVRSLEIGGQFFFSYPTDKSFPEWKSVCQKVNLPFTGNTLPGAEGLKIFTEPNEVTVTWHEYPYKLVFPHALEFFREIKNLGADASILQEIPMLHTQQLSIKEFRRLLAAWNQLLSTNTNIALNNEKSNRYSQTVDCTYWLVEGIITRHS